VGGHVEKIDDLTVQFNLKAPTALSVGLLVGSIWGGPVILPEHVWADKDPFTFTFYDAEQGWPIGTGPYKLVSATPTEFVWDRDDNWWGAQTGFLPLPEPKRLIWIIAAAEETKALLMADNQLDSAMNITLGAFEGILARNPNAIAWYPDLPFAWADPCPRQISFNMAAAPWDNANLRKAVSLIIDRNQIVEISYEGTSVPSKTMFVQYGGMGPYIDAIVAAGMGIDPVGHPTRAKR
jgi:peptide/nickel transport system substrate-binding protein